MSVIELDYRKIKDKFLKHVTTFFFSYKLSVMWCSVICLRCNVSFCSTRMMMMMVLLCVIIIRVFHSNDYWLLNTL